MILPPREKDKTEDEAKTNTTREKKASVKRNGKNSSKVSVLISGLVGRPLPDIQALVNTNIVRPAFAMIPVKRLFEMPPKFRKEIQYLLTVLETPIPSAICPGKKDITAYTPSASHISISLAGKPNKHITTRI